MDHTERYSTWVEVDLQAIEGNVRALAAHTQASLMAVVKADGYGHGAIAVAQAALRGGAVWFGVARIEEALELRESGISNPILLLSHLPKNRFQDAINAGLSFTIWDATHIQTASEASKQVGRPAHLHLKVDTGMSRIGVPLRDAVGIAQRISDHPQLVLEGLTSHLARADEKDGGSVDKQIQEFDSVIRDLEQLQCCPSIVHLANSAGVLWHPATHYTMVRLGIALYGLEPSSELRLSDEFQPALSWKSQLSQVKVLPPGRGVSYGHMYLTTRDERIGTIPVGYADGYRRTEGNTVLVGGKRVPVVGRVCMDQIMVQLDDVPSAQIGDEVVLIGTQGGNAMTAEDVAEIWGTINYEVTSMIGARVPRVYQGQ